MMARVTDSCGEHTMTEEDKNVERTTITKESERVVKLI